MWFRHEARPTECGGIKFRSALEATVADELTKLGVSWKHELPPHVGLGWTRPAHEPVPEPIRGYLPDFTITESSNYLELPLWVEVKPADLIAAVRDHVGCPELFEEDFTSTIDARAMHAAKLTEIWKPKALVEDVGQEVLVVAEINKHHKTSILMTPGGIVLSRNHPTVTHRRLVLERERDERKAEQEAKRAAERAAWRAQRETLRPLPAPDPQLVAYVRENGRSAMYDATCQVCRAWKPASSLVVAPGDDRWIAVCRDHLTVASVAS